LLAIAVRALGVATAADLADYYRFTQNETKPRLAELVEDRRLLPVTVDGWDAPAYLDPQARAPRRIAATALLAPFDPLIWDRARTERLFDFHYRISIYTPADKREHGYYVLPFLLGDRLVARLDLKADRAAGRLMVPGAHLEAGVAAGDVAPALAAELRLMAGWLGLSGITVSDSGPLATMLTGLVDQER
jgi:uncharacterized protein YcaQ